MHTLDKTSVPALFIATLMLMISSCSPLIPGATPTVIPVFTSPEPPVPSLTPTISSTPAASVTASPRPPYTATPEPGWVTGFAQPILEAIVDRPPDFQDDFGPGSAGWQSSQNCGKQISYGDGELVITHCVASRPNINFTDFVIEFDARILPGSANSSKWLFRYRDMGGFYDAGSLGHSIWIYSTRKVMLGFNDVWNGPTSYDFLAAAKAGNETNHLVVIGKGPTMAVFINDAPLFSIDAPVPQYGEFVFWSMEAVLGIDNLKVWNIGNLSNP